jgi:hypothetical protein
MRIAIAYCVMLVFSGISSGLALLNCPFLISPNHSSCCHEKAAPKQCPFSSSFDTCPLVTPDGKISPPQQAAAAVAVPAAETSPFVPVGFAPQLADWKRSRTGLHLRICVLLI